MRRFPVIMTAIMLMLFSTLALSLSAALASSFVQASGNKIVYVAESYSPDAAAAKPYGIYVYDADTQQDQLVFDPHKQLGSSGTVNGASWSSDGSKILFVGDKLTGQGEFLATIDSDGSNFKALTKPNVHIQINKPVFSPDGSQIAFSQFNRGEGGSTTSSQIVLVSADGSQQTPLSIEGMGGDYDHELDSVVWSSDGKQIALSGPQGIFVANADGSNLTKIVPGSSSGPPAWSHDGQQIAYSGFGRITSVDPTGANPQSLYEFNYGNVLTVAWSPDGKQMLLEVSASSGNGMVLLDIATKKVGLLVNASVDFSPGAWQPGGSSTPILPAQEAGALSLFAPPPTPTPMPTPVVAEGATQIRTLSGHSSAVLGVAFSPDSQSVLTASADNTLILWDVATGNQVQTFSGSQDHVYSVAFSPDGTMAVSGGGGENGDYAVRLWDVASGQVVKELKGNQSPVYGVAWSPDGKTVLSGGGDRVVRQWDVATGKLIRQLSGHSKAVDTVAFSPDGAQIVSASDDMTARIWNAKTGARVGTLTHDFPVLSAVFSPDGTSVLTGTQEGIAYLWDAKTRQQTQQFSGHNDLIESVAYSPGGAAVATASDDGSVRLWDVVSGAQITEYDGHSGSVRAVAFSPDGTMLVSGGVDSTARLWSVPASAVPPPTVAPPVATAEQSDVTASTSGTACAVTAGQTVKRRGGPGTTFAQNGTLTGGQTANAVGQTNGADGKTWYKLDDDTWVRSDLVQLDAACAGLPEAGG